MKKVIILLLLLAYPALAEDLTLNGIPTSVYFSPKGGCEQAIVNEINGAKKEVLVQAYSFTSVPIAQSLMAAKKRGIDVRVILDKSQVTTAYSMATFLLNQGIPTYIDSIHAIAHNKTIVIDNKEVITGSFNFTKSAEEKNAENLIIIRSTKLARIYAANWNLHLSHSVEYKK